MEKTAMQELIYEMNEMLIEGNGSIYVLKEQARKLLKKEKEQIIESYEAGIWDLGCRSTDAEQYYQETFKTNN